MSNSWTIKIKTHCCNWSVKIKYIKKTRIIRSGDINECRNLTGNLIETDPVNDAISSAFWLQQRREQRTLTAFTISAPIPGVHFAVERLSRGSDTVRGTGGGIFINRTKNSFTPERRKGKLISLLFWKILLLTDFHAKSPLYQIYTSGLSARSIRSAVQTSRARF